MRGGTRVTLLGEGVDAYSKTLDLINQRLINDNLFGISSVWYYNIPDFSMPAYGQHESAAAARASMKANVRCSFGVLGDAPVETVNYAGYCFLPAQMASGEACTENTTLTCLAPSAGSALRVKLSVSANGNDPLAGPHFVPVGWPDEVAGEYTYYVSPVASALIPPGGPVLGQTSVTVKGVGFAGLGADLSQLRCKFDETSGLALSVSALGDEVVCNTSAMGASNPNVRIALNAQDFDGLAPFRVYPRPAFREVSPTGGPALPAYVVTLHGTGFDGMDGVQMPYAVLCQFGDLVGAVASQGVVYDEEDGTTVVATHAVCVVPTPKHGLAGAAVVRLALNGFDFDDGTPSNPQQYTLETGLEVQPTRYSYYKQELVGLTPAGGPTGGGTSITVLGSGFQQFDGEAKTARCKFDYGGVVSIGPVTSIGSDGELAYPSRTAPSPLHGPPP